jgi:HEAT repeat protein
MEVNQAPSYLTRSRQASALQRLGEAQLKAGHLREAHHSAEAALEIQRSVMASDPEEWEAQAALVQMLILAGNTSAAEGDIQGAKSLLQEARTAA